MSGAAPRQTSTKTDATPAAVEAQRRLAQHLQTRVRVEMGKRKGKIVLDFVSPDDLDRISRIVLGEAAGSNASTASPDN
jgi:ParB family chromosome partitioning protein